MPSFINLRIIRFIDWKILPVILTLMGVSLLTLSSFSPQPSGDPGDEVFLTPIVKSQIQWFLIGIGVYLFFSAFDYNKLREWTWILYIITLILLVGLFLTPAIQRVHRWYRIPLINYSFQPSEYAKLVVVIALSWFLERRRPISRQLSTAIGGMLITGIPFLLILKQPDLGTALVLIPITLVMFYFGNVNPAIVRFGIGGLCLGLVIVGLIFSGLIPHEQARPVVTRYIRDYQYERLNPDLHHQWASTTAIASGGVAGKGWFNGEFTRHGWLPAPYTDSVFPAFGEEFGLLGLLFVMALFYALLYFSFQVAIMAQDPFGRLLAAGIAVYLAVHILLNIGMMCGLLPVTGVPLILVSYGGSSILSTMMALGILQSIYSRRFMF